MSDSSSLAHLLEPVLISACQSRLSNLQWFKSAWQAGGAATGFATFAVDGRDPVEVVVKLPVGPAEFRWTTGLGGLSSAPTDGRTELSPGYACALGPTPRVYAAGTELGGYDLAWLVVERFTGPPLSAAISARSLEDLLTTAAEWYALAERLRPIEGASTPTKDWSALIDKARRIVPECGIEHDQRWNQALKQTQKLLPKLLAVWNARSINAWCHGDLHPGNAMRRPLDPDDLTASAARSALDRGGCVLIDLALVHPGHWIEDAVYLERLFWGRSERLEGVKPVSVLAQARRERGLPTSDDYTLLANVRRVLMAACVPCFLTHEGHPKYVRASLETLERLLPVVTKL